MLMIAALVIGFLGAMLVIRPGLAAVDTGSILILISALGWAGVTLIVKELARTDSSITITAWMIVLMTPMSLIPALFVWQWPTPREWFRLARAGIAGTLGQLLVAQAFRVADTTAVIPFDFSKLIWASVLGYLVFSEVPSLWTWTGGAIVFAGACDVALRERQEQTRATSG
jgi:drug/metabolite transporter (DMT)-like permease